MRIPPSENAPCGRESPDDGSLVRGMLGGDREAAATLARRYLRAAYAVALAVTGNPADAEDVAQEAFVVAIGRVGECREPAKFAGWLLTIVRNRARNVRDAFPAGRSDPWQDGIDGTPTAPDPSDDAGRRETADRLLQALDGLGPVPREVVLLHDLEGWRHAEIAQALDLSEGMSRQHLFAAHRILRERLGGSAPAGGCDG